MSLRGNQLLVACSSRLPVRSIRSRIPRTKRVKRTSIPPVSRPSIHATPSQAPLHALDKLVAQAPRLSYDIAADSLYTLFQASRTTSCLSQLLQLFFVELHLQRHVCFFGLEISAHSPRCLWCVPLPFLPFTITLFKRARPPRPATPAVELPRLNIRRVPQPGASQLRTVLLCTTLHYNLSPTHGKPATTNSLCPHFRSS